MVDEMNNHQFYDCKIHYYLEGNEYLKGPIINLKLNQFYNEDIPFYDYDIMKGEQTIGKIRLRLGYHENSFIDGQVGYEIMDQYQGLHYSYYALELIKALAKEHGYRHLLITAEPNNLASLKIISQAGGELIISEYPIPKEHILYVLGKKTINVYAIKI
jgi:predicted acetyltransferase